MFFFFFSSRRRHTRCLSDWSSDVCSSDLTGGNSGRNSFTSTPMTRAVREISGRENEKPKAPSESSPPKAERRSEERRVGKECRYGWWTSDEKKREETTGAGGDARRRRGRQ